MPLSWSFVVEFGVAGRGFLDVPAAGVVDEEAEAGALKSATSNLVGEKYQV